MRILILCMFFIVGCSVKLERPEIKGFVYDKITKKPISNVEIITFNDGQIITESITDTLGMFYLKAIKSSHLLDFESGNDPKFYDIILKHRNYLTDSLQEKTRGSFINELKVYDTIFLSKKPRN
ncbi:hypothetical protein [Flavobacterium columnare]|uniref:Uncharacterized protein n=2 Tax=Flavobacterium columnare TaxID=996 RepID=A0AA94F1C7_9FLAO|nr:MULTISPECIES: hypothetical protein [Flavobacterium]MCH4828952.1 hypothetical protein [Flavobacterium columnare]MCH4831714.1 hypothetical protein [Flavobacterium columnare]QYS90639.1 hypothetical protein JJC04_11580 [Flavobacterium covae]